MKINYKSIVIGEHTGYGNASRLLLKALNDRSVTVQADSSVALNFCMPPDYEFSDVTIGYTPWESTEVPKTWVAGLKAVDDLWTTSSWVADVFSRYRKEKPFVLPHGIEECWTPIKHHREDRPFTFLHVGEPAERKGGDIVLKAWSRRFAKRNDVRLIYKCVKYPACRIKDERGSIIASPETFNNVAVISNIYNQTQLWKLYRDSDCMVYPTRGEGFGLIPFEAMASGLPTILPQQGGTSDFARWSPLTIKDSIWVHSAEEVIHPGLWMDHSVDEVIFLMETMMENYELLSEDAFVAANNLHKLYSWDNIGAMAEKRLVEYH